MDGWRHRDLCDRRSDHDPGRHRLGGEPDLQAARHRIGGGLTVVGLVIGLMTYRYYRSRRPSVFPVPFRPQRAAESIATALGNRPSAGEVLVILPHDQLAAEAVMAAATHAAAGRGAVFLYRGDRYPNQHHELLEVADPYLRDFSAHDAFARAEMLARGHVKNRRYVYML